MSHSEAAPLARHSDPSGAKAAAIAAGYTAGRFKALALLILTEHLRDGTPQEVAFFALSQGWITLRSVESVRRRVSDLWKDGRLNRTGTERGNALVYRLANPGTSNG